MTTFNFDLQRFADVLNGKSSGDQISALEDKTQVYGLAGNDTLKSYGKSDVLLIGGSGNDVLQMTGGKGTLVGGKGKDTFKLNYSADKKISAVIEDIDPTNDKIVVTFDGTATPKLTSKVSGKDVVWTDDKGYFNLTLKGSSDASDYFDGTAHEYVWDVLRLTNQEREKQGLPPLILSQGLTDGASIRSAELIKVYGHTRPDGTDCWTAVKKSYRTMGENAYQSPTTPDDAVIGWMNSTGHRANILNSNYNKLGVGYTYNANAQWKHYWIQMFGGGLTIDGAGSLNVTAGSQGSGIGYNSYAESKANIIINGTTITATTNMGAGIGSGANGSIGNITINGGNVTAKSTWGAEIGAGCSGSAGKVTKNQNVVNTDTLAVTNSTKSPVTVASAIKVIDASKRTSAVKITGNTLANTIIGGIGNDTLDGGIGNDSLWGDAGKDTFLYSSGDGKDIIYSFENNDLLQITGTFSASYNKSKKEIAFKVGSTTNAITLRDFTATSFNVNGDIYSISNNKFLKK